MPKFSAFTRFGMFRFSGAPPVSQRIYESHVAAVSDPETGIAQFDLTQGTHYDASFYADAMAYGAAALTDERAANQRDPLKATDLLALREKDYQVIPAETDGLHARRAAVAARRLANRGSRRESIVDALRTLLGDDFLGYRVPEAAERDCQPTTAGNDFRAQDIRIPARNLAITDPITDLGVATWVSYENLDTTEGADELYLVKNEWAMIQPDNTGQAEAILILDARGAGATREVQIICNKAHHVGAIVTTANWPVQTSTARSVIVVVKEAAAIDPEKRRKVHELMQRMARSVTTWAIAKPVSAGSTTVGPATFPFTLGAVSTEAITFVVEP